MKYSILIVCVIGLVSVIGFSIFELRIQKQKSRRFDRTV